MRILLVTSRYPWPPRRGDALRALQIAELLADRAGGAHQVTLLAPEPGELSGRPELSASSRRPDPQQSDPGDGEGVVPGRASSPPFRVETYPTQRRSALAGVARAVLSGGPWQSGLYRQPGLSRRLRELAPEADLVILQLVRLAGYVEDLGDTPFLADLIDSLSLNFERRARYESPLRAPIFAAEAERLSAAEADLVARSAGALLVCDRDRAWLADRLPAAPSRRLHTVPLLVEGPFQGPSVPQRSLESTESSVAPSPKLVLTGNLGYFPTVDAIDWWVAEVWPVLRRDHPSLTLTLAGSRPASPVRRAARAPGIELLDTPPDLAPILASATAAIAPMRAGSGVPVKILEAWSAGVPVLASPYAAAGAAARPGFELLVADTVEDWRAAVTRLLTDPTLPPRLTQAGRDHLRQHHSRAAVQGALLKALP